MGIIIKRKIDIEKQIDDFLDKVSESGLIFKSGVEAYLAKSVEPFEKELESIAGTEHHGEALHRFVYEKNC